MCGIAGYFSRETNVLLNSALQKAAYSLSKRGPDCQQQEVLSPHVGFAHARLSIIDTSVVANQPMVDASGRYTIVFNGEIFNYRELQQQYLQNVQLKSHSDTEVLLYLFAKLGKGCVNLLNGFFAFAIYDKHTEEIFLARDRYGIKPLHVYSHNGLIVFASEMKAILQFPVKREIDFSTLLLYLQLNYIPDEQSMLRHIKRVKPGHYTVIDKEGNVSEGAYYSVPYQPGNVVSDTTVNYNEAQVQLRNLIEKAVERRLVSDVPLGTFLSGGIDSSIITACAAKHVSNLSTFSIGYTDEPYFDETSYANLVAKKFGTTHTVFSVSNAEMFENIFEILNTVDEPFADSSSIAVYILCKKTRQQVTVALSGDGGDELFAGYNKHRAELMARNNSPFNLLAKTLHPAFSLLPKSRHSSILNKLRQAERYGKGLLLNYADRYWQWCSFQSAAEASSLLKATNQLLLAEAEQRANEIKKSITTSGDLNDVLYADTKMVLPGDMLTKVDLMSMANSLEVRVPLLDYTIVDFAFTLPVSFKIQGNNSKRILKDAFRDELPPELFIRPKHGFEVPLLKWLRTDLRHTIENDLLSHSFIEQQGIFNAAAIAQLKSRLFSNNPGDSHATVWALTVFQYWYKRYFLS